MVSKEQLAGSLMLDPGTAQLLLSEICDSPSSGRATAIAEAMGGNPAAPAAVLRELVGSFGYATDNSVAANPSAPPDALLKLARYRIFEWALAGNPSTPEAAQQIIRQSDTKVVLERLDRTRAMATLGRHAG